MTAAARYPFSRLARCYSYFQVVAPAEAALLLSFLGVMQVLCNCLAKSPVSGEKPPDVFVHAMRRDQCRT